MDLRSGLERSALSAPPTGLIQGPFQVRMMGDTDLLVERESGPVYFDITVYWTNP